MKVFLAWQIPVAMMTAHTAVCSSRFRLKSPVPVLRMASCTHLHVPYGYPMSRLIRRFESSTEDYERKNASFLKD